MDIDKLESRLLKHLFSMRSDFMHPYIGVKIRAYQSTVSFIEENMINSAVCNNRNEVFNYALKHLTCDDGLILEFGVKSGKTITELAIKPQLQKKTIYGFDSFIGIPEDWLGTKTLKGQLSNEGKIPKVPKNVKLIEGWFKDTIDTFKENHKNNISLMHIDCDLYSSTNDILTKLKEQISTGTIIIFDEFFNYPNWQSHEYKAWQEFIDNNDIKYKYLCYAHTQVAVIIL